MTSNDNYGFSGPAPDGVSVADNVSRALDYQANHSIAETIDWFYETVRNNKDGHLSADLSMDYKQIDPQYADFGNFNYAVVGKAIGFPDWVLKYMAGWAQGKADKLDNTDAIIRAALDPANRGDHQEDQHNNNRGQTPFFDRGHTPFFATLRRSLS